MEKAMNLYSIDITLAATAYIKAETVEEAAANLGILHMDCLDVNDTSWFSDAMLGSPDLPEISLSPAMTIYGPFPEAELYACAEKGYVMPAA